MLISSTLFFLQRKSHNLLKPIDNQTNWKEKKMRMAIKTKLLSDFLLIDLIWLRFFIDWFD